MTAIKESIRKSAEFFSKPTVLIFDSDEVNTFAKCVLKYMDLEGGSMMSGWGDDVSDGTPDTNSRMSDMRNRLEAESKRVVKLDEENVRLQRDLERSELLLRELKDLYRSLKFIKLEPEGEPG